MIEVSSSKGTVDKYTVSWDEIPKFKNKIKSPRQG